MIISSPSWLDQILQAPEVDEICRQISLCQAVSALGGCGSSSTLVAGALAWRTARPVLMVVAHVDDADDVLEDLDLFRGAGMDLPVGRLGALEALPGESGVNPELLAERLGIVESLLSGDGRIADQGPSLLVAPIQALMQSVPMAEAIHEFSLSVKAGDDLPLGRLVQWLTDVGYQRCDAVEQPGDFAVRGGIVDVYPPSGSIDQCVGGSWAVRLDYFGDQVESIHLVDPETLGSGDRIVRCRLVGAATDRILNDDRTTSVFSLLSDDTIVVLHEMLELAEQARGYYERLINPRGIYPPDAVFREATGRCHVRIDQYSGVGLADKTIELPARMLPGFDHAAKQAVAELAGLASGDGWSGSSPQPSGRSSQEGQDQPARVVVMCAQTGERDRLLELLDEHAPSVQGKVDVQIGYLHRGFVWDGPGSERLFVVPHHELFHRYHVRRPVFRWRCRGFRQTFPGCFRDRGATGDRCVPRPGGRRLCGARRARDSAVHWPACDEASWSEGRQRGVSHA